ncbi:hypothetical protein Tco_0177944 [Tanacetum coccineum]
MQIPAWIIIDEMKLTEHYRMYAEVLFWDRFREEQCGKRKCGIGLNGALGKLKKLKRLVDDRILLMIVQSLGMMNQIFLAHEAKKNRLPITVQDKTVPPALKMLQELFYELQRTYGLLVCTSTGDVHAKKVMSNH